MTGTFQIFDNFKITDFRTFSEILSPFHTSFFSPLCHFYSTPYRNQIIFKDLERV